jgi:hypothetical protein
MEFNFDERDKSTFEDYHYDPDIYRAVGSVYEAEESYGFHSVQMSEMATFDQFDFDPKFRSMQAYETHSVSGNQVSKYDYSSSSLQSYGSTVQGPPQLTKEERKSTFPFIEFPPTKAHQILVESSSANIVVPEKPFFLGPTQFITTLCLVDLVSKISQKLDEYFEVSYHFFPDQCRWEIVILRGSSRSKFEINVFRENSSSFLVEGNRLSGDSSSFHNVYCDIQSSLTKDTKPAKKNRTLECFPLPATEQLSMDDAMSAIKPILSMATAEHLESRVEGAKMLCDLSLQPDLQSTLIEAGGIDVLMELVYIDFCSCNQYAMCALANLSSSRSCQEILIKGSKFLQTLVSMITDGPYHTTEMRRECARTFANLCCGASNGRKIISTIGVDSASSWISSVDNLRDERLKLHAGRAKMQMEACM